MRPDLHTHARSERDLASGERWLELSMRTALDGPSGPFDLDVSIGIEKGSFIAIIGPSGAGKTTLLRLMAGLARPDLGRLTVGGAIWCDTRMRQHLPTRLRSIGFVFQDYALFPNMTVRGNLEYAMGSARRADEVRELLDRVELGGLGDAYPARLSGGQRQRLALIRAVARRPALLMLDEPLSALDETLRRRLQDDLRSIHASFGTTTIMVSHDASEVIRLADRVIRLESGRITFDGAPTAAFGAAPSHAGLALTARHVSGPDEKGMCTVIIDGRMQRIRYRGAPRDIAPGDTLLLEATEVDAQRMA